MHAFLKNDLTRCRYNLIALRLWSCLRPRVGPFIAVGGLPHGCGFYYAKTTRGSKTPDFLLAGAGVEPGSCVPLFCIGFA